MLCHACFLPQRDTYPLAAIYHDLIKCSFWHVLHQHNLVILSYLETFNMLKETQSMFMIILVLSSFGPRSRSHLEMKQMCMSDN